MQKADLLGNPAIGFFLHAAPGQQQQ